MSKEKKERVVKPTVDEILKSTPLDQLRLVWHTEKPEGHEVLWSFRAQRHFPIEVCRNCGLKGLHVTYVPEDLSGLTVDINKFVHVELEHEEGFTILSECVLSPITGFWKPYMNLIFAKMLQK